MTRSLWLAAVLAAGCAAGEAGERFTPARLGEEARIILEAECGSCHLGELPSAVPAALAVFDLSTATWAEGLDAARLRNMVFRLAQPVGEDGEARAVPPRDQVLFAAFATQELARRATAP